MNNVTEINIKKELSNKQINLMFTENEKNFYQVIAKTNGVTLTKLIKNVLEKEFGTVKQFERSNLKDLGIKTNKV